MRHAVLHPAVLGRAESTIRCAAPPCLKRIVQTRVAADLLQKCLILYSLFCLGLCKQLHQITICDETNHMNTQAYSS